MVVEPVAVVNLLKTWTSVGETVPHIVPPSVIVLGIMPGMWLSVRLSVRS